MGKIQVLDKQLSEKIAAGEVVERPASVVKELVENAIDAGAGEITVEIDRGGILLIRVTDNGCGIAREDVQTAFLRHATSKIKGQDDLDAIATLGFRGEALAAICAVSKVEMITRTAEETAGTRYLCAGGEEAALEDAGCAVGTSIAVREIFYNTPARMKFLKKDVSEANAVSGVVDKIALSHPEVAFKLIRDGKVTLNTPGDNKLNSAIYTVLGREFTASLIPVDYQYEGIGVVGYTSKPTACRPNRNMQYFFINGRLVKSKTMMAAAEQAYRNASMTGKFPACVLHVSIPFGAVDVNVHPAKTEVRFSDERRIFSAIYVALKNAVTGAAGNSNSLSVDSAKASPPKQSSFFEKQKPSQTAIRQFWEATAPKGAKPFGAPGGASATRTDTISLGKTASAPQTAEDGERASAVPRDKVYFADSGKSLYAPSGNYVNLDILVDDETSPGERSAPDTAQPAENRQVDITYDPMGGSEVELSAELAVHTAEETYAEQDSAAVESPRPPVRVIGEVFSTYILAEQGDDFILIDKHAAHERIIFNELCQNEAPQQQLLLAPVTVSLPKNEYGAVIENLDILNKTGYEVEDFGGSVLVRAVPVYLAGEDIAALISEAAGGFLQHRRDAVGKKMEWLYESVACRAAVKAGDSLTLPELTALAERILYHNDILYCPHGRPVTVRMSKKELEKRFGRIQ